MLTANRPSTPPPIWKNRTSSIVGRPRLGTRAPGRTASVSRGRLAAIGTASAVSSASTTNTCRGPRVAVSHDPASSASTGPTRWIARLHPMRPPAPDRSPTAYPSVISTSAA